MGELWLLKVARVTAGGVIGVSRGDVFEGKLVKRDLISFALVRVTSGVQFSRFYLR